MIANKLEALLYGFGRTVSKEKIMKILKIDERELESAIKTLMDRYKKDDTCFKLIVTNDSLMLTVKDRYSYLLKEIVKEPEMPKAVIETLAVIAWKAPIEQSKIIELRNNKAYNHIKYLEQKGLIRKRKKGKTYIIELTDRFYDYFEIDKERIKQELTKIKELEK